MLERLAIHLLGAPAVTREDVRQSPPRGRKAWALLAYLLATESAPSREWLAELLFADAEDPLNALSWNLSQLRRLLGPDAHIGGDQVELRLPPGAYVDIKALTAGTWLQAFDIPGLGHELLEGMAFSSSPAFEVWLLTERRRLTGAAEDVLREADEPALVSESPRLDLLPERLQVGVCRGGAEEEGARATVDPGLRRGVERDLAARIRLLDQRPDHRSFLDGHVRAVRSARDGRVDHGLEQPGLAAEGVIDRLDDDPCLRRDKSEPATARARRRAPSMLATMRVARATKSRPTLGPTAMLPTEAQRV